jgi:hypothetical protein
MKEVFTKSFWEGVKKTFDEARDGLPPMEKVVKIPAEADQSASSSSEPPATRGTDPPSI